jgi:hypothetical protein
MWWAYKGEHPTDEALSDVLGMSASPPTRPYCRTAANRRDVPCVDGSELARAFFTFAALVGAAMCSGL